MDDVNIHNNDWNDHLEHLRLVLEKLKSVNLKLNLGKCCFGTRGVTFLRHVVNQHGFRLHQPRYM